MVGEAEFGRHIHQLCNAKAHNELAHPANLILPATRRQLRATVHVRHGRAPAIDAELSQGSIDLDWATVIVCARSGLKEAIGPDHCPPHVRRGTTVEAQSLRRLTEIALDDIREFLDS